MWPNNNSALTGKLTGELVDVFVWQLTPNAAEIFRHIATTLLK